jgi:N-acetylglucosamine kinase-like BadF-type ATPase
MANSKGLALVYGAKGTITLFTPSGTALTTGAITTIESYDETHEADVEQIKNSAGEVVAQVSANERITLNVTFIPSAASFAQAKLAAGLPAVNGYATIASSDGVTIGSGASNSLDGNYVYAGGGSVIFTSSG